AEDLRCPGLRRGPGVRVGEEAHLPRLQVLQGLHLPLSGLDRARPRPLVAGVSLFCLPPTLSARTSARPTQPRPATITNPQARVIAQASRRAPLRPSARRGRATAGRAPRRRRIPPAPGYAPGSPTAR